MSLTILEGCFFDDLSENICIKTINYSDVKVGSFSLLLVGLEKGLIQRLIRLTMIIRQHLQIQLWDLDLCCGFTIES